MLSEEKTEFYEKKSIMFFWSVIFFIVSFFIILCFSLQKKAFYRYDGITQHLTVLGYLGNYFRFILFSFFKSGRFIIPQWDFSLGLGADVITTLHYYGLGDVLNLSAIFVPLKYTEILYVFLIFLRLYLSGIAFLYYARYHNFSKYASLTGAVTYVFCGFSYYCAVRHPFFINPMIYMPFILAGLDKLLVKKSCITFVTTSFLLCLASYYFFYVATIIVVFYALVRFFFRVERKSFSIFLKYFFSIAGLYFIAICMAAFILLPNIAGFFGSSRSSFSEPIPSFYLLSYYVELFFSLISPIQSFSYTELGYSAIVLPFLILCLTVKSIKAKQIKIFICLAVLLLSFPFFGHMFNGFNYVTNRWCFSVSFLTGLLVAYISDSISEIDIKNIKRVFLLCASLAITVILASLFSQKIRSHLFLSYAVLLCFSIIFFIPKTRKLIFDKRFILVFCTFSVLVNIFVKYSPQNLNYLNDFYENGSTKKYLNNQTDRYFSEISSTKDFFRVEEENKYYLNAPSVFGYSGLSYYWSQNSACLSDFYEKLELCTGKKLSLNGVNRRTYVQDLLNTKVIAVQDAELIYKPYDSTQVLQNENVSFFERNNHLPFSFTYSSVIPKSQFENYNAIEKQLSMMQCAVIESDDFNETSLVQQKNIDFSSLSSVDFNLKADSGLELEGNTIKVLKKNAELKVEFNDIKARELYLEVKNLFYETDAGEKIKVEYESSISAPQEFEIPTGYEKKNHNFLMCAGYTENSINHFKLRFPEKGIYAFSEMNVYDLDLSERRSFIYNLSQDTMQNVIFSANSIKGDISLKEGKLLCLSMPYATGWKCFVDGKKVPVYKVNVLFSGVYLDKGFHEIVFKYSCPLFNVGIVIAILAAIVFLIILKFENINKIFI